MNALPIKDRYLCHRVMKSEVTIKICKCKLLKFETKHQLFELIQKLLAAIDQLSRLYYNSLKFFDKISRVSLSFLVFSSKKRRATQKTYETIVSCLFTYNHLSLRNRFVFAWNQLKKCLARYKFP